MARFLDIDYGNRFVSLSSAATKSRGQDYDHPLWKRWEESAVGAGHGGMSLA